MLIYLRSQTVVRSAKLSIFGFNEVAAMNWRKNGLAAFGFGLMSAGAVLLAYGGPESFAAPEAEAPAGEAVTAKPVDEKPYTPTPENLAAREWFQDARFGVFIHWGIYSVLGRGEWVMNIEKMPIADYEKLPPQFNPEKFDAAEWVATFKRAGAKYITITSKHHDGFGMWDSKVSDWDIVDRTPYKHDVLKQLADECDKQGIKLFFYYSQLDWHHPDYYPARHDRQNRRAGPTPAIGTSTSPTWTPSSPSSSAASTARSAASGSTAGGTSRPSACDGKKNADPLATNLDWHLRRTYDMIHAPAARLPDRREPSRAARSPAKTSRCTSATCPARTRADTARTPRSATCRSRPATRSMAPGATTPTTSNSSRCRT